MRTVALPDVAVEGLAPREQLMGTGSTLPPPVGDYRHIGGVQLLVDQQGSGSPTVVFLPGAGLTGLDYLPLHELAAVSWSSLLYDRGGTGWSDPVALPRTVLAVTDELRELISLSVQGPVVLVGHSLGGLYARHYATRFPEDVQGLVLLDPAHEDYDAYMPAELTAMRSGNRLFALLNVIVDLALTTPPTKALLGILPPIRRYQQLYRRLFEEEMADWQPQVREVLVAKHASLDWLAVGLRESRDIDDLYREVRDAGPMPDLPLVILSSTGTDAFRDAVSSGESPQLLQAEADAKLRLYGDIAASVTRSRVLPVNGGHVTLPFRHVAKISEAIREVSS
jgi:pimeloyl-ACP methyl ester carboxylesterase